MSKQQVWTQDEINKLLYTIEDYTFTAQKVHVQMLKILLTIKHILFYTEVVCLDMRYVSI